MRVLGIDTSGYFNAVGIVDGDRVLADFTFAARTDSLEKIITHIDGALRSANLALADVEGLGVGLGPGSWTGIKVGVTVGKSLAMATGRPLAGIATLEAMASDAVDSAVLVCPVISAGPRDMVYAACYRVNDGVASIAGEYYAGDVKGLLAMVRGDTVFLAGEAQSYRQLAGQIAASAASGLKVVQGVLSGSAVARLAAARLSRGERDDPLALTPLYLKESTARVFQGGYLQARGREA